MAGSVRPDLRPMGPGDPPGRGSGASGSGAGGASDRVEGNARLTSSTAVALFVLLAVEGATVVSVRSLLSVHVFVGVLLIPPVLLKMGSTLYRFARYYQGAPAYLEKGPPPWALRLLGPAVVLLTVVLFASGVALMYVSPSWHGRLLTVHKASFVLWFIVMTVHVLSHLSDTIRLGLPDWVCGPRRLSGAGLRRGALLAGLAAGAGAGAVVLGRVTPYLASVPHHFG